MAVFDTFIRLMNVPFDNTYTHVIHYADNEERDTKMAKYSVMTLDDYTFIRKNLPGGSMRSSVKVDANYDTLQSLGVNYLTFANTANRTIYAFVTQIIYINDRVSELVFETDVYQTWFFDCTFMPSYIVREHTPTDEIGDNIVPESFTFEDYSYEQACDFNLLDTYGYLVGTSDASPEFGGTRGRRISGIYQGMYFYYFSDRNNLTFLINEMEEEGLDCIQFIACIPEFCVTGGAGWDSEDDGDVGNSATPEYNTADFDFIAANIDFDGYTPRNNKLYTNPFLNLVVSNHAGDEAVYNIEEFGLYDDPADKQLRFDVWGDISANPTVTLHPADYKGVSLNYDAGISISGFPQCSYITDSFKLWLAKNQYSVGGDLASGALKIVGGAGAAAIGVATGGAGVAAGGASIISGFKSIAGSINGVYAASKEPNRCHSGATKTNLLTGIGINKFDFYYRKIKGEHARTIDDFFTMYGYQVNKISIPHFGCRARWYYIQTANVVIDAGVPQDDLVKLKNIFNTGVTMWEPGVTIGNYYASNHPV